MEISGGEEKLPQTPQLQSELPPRQTKNRDDDENDNNGKKYTLQYVVSHPSEFRNTELALRMLECKQADYALLDLLCADLLRSVGVQPATLRDQSILRYITKKAQEEKRK